MSLDIVNGVFHFPNGPWILEYDEAGFAWLMVPWVMVAGEDWPAFRFFGILVSSLVPLFLTWTAARRFGLRTGFTAGLLMATAPAQLVWDRYLFMSAVSAMSILWLLALSLVDRSPDRRSNRVIPAGLLVAASCYIGHYSVVISANNHRCNLVECFRMEKQNRRDRSFFFRSLQRYHSSSDPSSASSGICTLARKTLPRSRPTGVRYHRSVSLQLSKVISEISSGEVMSSLFLRKNVPVLSPAMSVLVLVGLIGILTTRRRSFWFAIRSGSDILHYDGADTGRKLEWGLSFARYAIFCSYLGTSESKVYYLDYSRCLSRRLVTAVYVLLMTAIVTDNCYKFFWGSYSIHPRPDSLTRLQEDLSELESIPYLFSDRIQEVAHYHCPSGWRRGVIRNGSRFSAGMNPDGLRIPTNFRSSLSLSNRTEPVL